MPIGGALAGGGSALQPAQQACFLCHTTHTDKAINQNGPGGLVIQLL